MTSVAATPTHSSEGGMLRAALPQLVPFLGILALALFLPLVGNDYWALIGTRMAIYWVLVSGLNLIVGFAGHLAIGYVALLALGAYATSVLVAGNVMPPVPVFAALPVAGVVGALFGVIVGLPALRLRTFYVQHRLGLLLSLHRICRFDHLDERQHRPQPVRPRADRGARRRGRGGSHRYFQAEDADRDLPVRRCAGGDRRRTVRDLANLYHTGCLHLRFVRAVLHRDPDRWPRLDPGADARHHDSDRAAGDRSPPWRHGRPFSTPCCCW